ncbi:MAG: HAMP domain-containing sensor histidine kinase, partial [Planctomycetota bacterium]|nr:HAMP domain-containing sensor histidine kinase [Planctomycetota bacterium]
TGCGIPAEMTERVFERFFQIEPSRTGDTKVRGTGLGLAIVQHATERLGGKVTLDSTPGKGTTVTVRITRASN